MNEEIIYCSNCKAPLVSLIRSPREGVSRIVVYCDHCGDKSETIDTKNKLFIGSTEYTLFDEMEDKGSYTVIKTKVKQPWKKK